ncbi:hypothetical protein BJ508DRAFT_305809 [Ascobolus immersus RN42]|uniref:Uncharacterized protein n=1 Tax=Ascobolus immersus RN42 TaxID=1160509 RepID=A0A3N4I7V4_ASCIM|nr:hypothetical protein BJ508DRAFT_305809 [Ascobolus immersus RN42]
MTASVISSSLLEGACVVIRYPVASPDPSPINFQNSIRDRDGYRFSIIFSCFSSALFQQTLHFASSSTLIRVLCAFSSPYSYELQACSKGSRITEDRRQGNEHQYSQCDSLECRKKVSWECRPDGETGTDIVFAPVKTVYGLPALGAAGRDCPGCGAFICVECDKKTGGAIFAKHTVWRQHGQGGASAQSTAADDIAQQMAKFTWS